MGRGEGVGDSTGHWRGGVAERVDPAGNIRVSGAAEKLKKILVGALGDDVFRVQRRYESADSAIFTRKVGHTQRGGRPIEFDRFHAAQLGGNAVEMLVHGQNNTMSILQWSEQNGFVYESLAASKLRDRWNRPEEHTSVFQSRR
mgnify:CR=1 FL=1